MDFYKNFQNLKKSFEKFIDKTPAFDNFINLDDIELKRITSKMSNKAFLLTDLIKIQIIKYLMQYIKEVTQS